MTQFHDMAGILFTTFVEKNSSVFHRTIPHMMRASRVVLTRSVVPPSSQSRNAADGLPSILGQTWVEHGSGRLPTPDPLQNLTCPTFPPDFGAQKAKGVLQTPPKGWLPDAWERCIQNTLSTKPRRHISSNPALPTSVPSDSHAVFSPINPYRTEDKSDVRP